ncbi:hypothetical protein ACH5RR_026276 [Cinchona calisaya]|uniref:Uncharacterized protein n=1 Tax=Cinchona calisaya TaxID=153742 RepID=A0ABD2Z382_9GENT
MNGEDVNGTRVERNLKEADQLNKELTLLKNKASGVGGYGKNIKKSEGLGEEAGSGVKGKEKQGVTEIGKSFTPMKIKSMMDKILEGLNHESKSPVEF